MPSDFSAHAKKSAVWRSVVYSGTYSVSSQHVPGVSLLSLNYLRNSTVIQKVILITDPQSLANQISSNEPWTRKPSDCRALVASMLTWTSRAAVVSLTNPTPRCRASDRLNFRKIEFQRWQKRMTSTGYANVTSQSKRRTHKADAKHRGPNS